MFELFLKWWFWMIVGIIILELIDYRLKIKIVKLEMGLK